VRVGHCQAPKLDESQPEKSADMAQLVERTLGKGEVPSSTLGISTIKYEALSNCSGLFVYVCFSIKSEVTRFLINLFFLK
jgi:hypothetical protein